MSAATIRWWRQLPKHDAHGHQLYRAIDMALLLLLCDLASSDRTATVSLRDLERQMGRDRSSNRQSVTRLEAAGLLRVMRRPSGGGIANTYYLPMPEGSPWRHWERMAGNS